MNRNAKSHYFSLFDLFDEKPNFRNVVLAIFLLICFSRIILYLTYLIIGIYTNRNIDFISFINNTNTYDCGWYKTIIEGGYGHIIEDGQANWAFFPMMPLVIAVFRFVIPIDTYLLGFIINTLILFFTCLLVYKYILLTRNNSHLALFIIFILIFGPYSWYCSILYSESLYLLLLILILYFIETKKYIAMGFAGMFFTATRNTGIFIVLIVLISVIDNYVRTEKNKSITNFLVTVLSDHKLILGVFMIPLGLFSYMLFLFIRFGDGLAFLHVQHAWWRENVGFFKSLYLGAVNMPVNFVITISSIFFCGFLIYKKRFVEGIFPLIIILIGGMSTLGSMQRYIFSSLTVLFGFSEFIFSLSATNRSFIKLPVIAILAGSEIALFYVWLTIQNAYYVF